MKKRVGSSQLQLTFDFMEMSLFRAAVRVGFKSDNEGEFESLAKESIRAVSAAIVRAERMPAFPFDVALLARPQKVECQGSNQITFKESLRGLLVWSRPFGIGGLPSAARACLGVDLGSLSHEDLLALTAWLEFAIRQIEKQSRERQREKPLWGKEARL